MNSDDIPEIYSKVANGYIRYFASGYNFVTQPTKLKLKLENSKTERYYQYAKFQVELCKSRDWKPDEPWFLCFEDRHPDFVKQSLLQNVNYQDEVYNMVYTYVYDRCLETCDEKTMHVELGRKPQPVSTNVLATEPFPANMLFIYTHVPESLRHKLNSWLNCSFEVNVSGGDMQVHSDNGQTIPCWNFLRCLPGAESRFDRHSRWILERCYANRPQVTDMHFTIELYFQLTAHGLHPDVFMPDYFTRIEPRPWTGEMVRVFGSSGDVSYCYLAALKSSSPVFEVQIRWNKPKENLTLELRSEVLEAFIEFISYSNFTPATKSFMLAVELLFAANKYDVKEFQDKLLDWIYVLPLPAFDDAEALVELYLLLEVTRISNCVFSRIEGIIKLKANEILSSPIYQELDATQKSLISSLISTYDVVLDIISLWSDNKHSTLYAEKYADSEVQMETDIRFQALHKRKPWQLCCDYLNYCNFTPDGKAPPGEVPEELIKIERRRRRPIDADIPFSYITHLYYDIEEIPELICNAAESARAGEPGSQNIEDFTIHVIY